MTRRTLKTTTASILALSLIQPYPAMAQLRALNPQAAQHSSVSTGSERIFLAQAEDATCFTDGEVDTARCDIDMMRAELEALLENGLPDAADRPAEDELTAALTAEERIGLLSAAIEDAEREASLEAETVANAEAEATVAAEAEAAARAEAEQAAAAQAAAEETALKEAEAAAAAEAEAAMAAEAEAEAAARAEAEEAAAAGAAAEEAAAAEAARLAEAEAEADAAVEAEAAATAEAEAATEAETTAEGEVSADAEAEALREALTDAVAADTAETDSGEAEPAPEATAEAEMETPVEAEAPAEGATTDTAAEEVPADAAPVAEAPAAEAPVEATSTPQAETLVTSEEETEASALKDAEILAEQEAAQTLGAVASALAGEEADEPAGTTDGTASDADPAAEAEAESEVTTEVVTEQDVRSSDEEFAAPAISSAAAPQAVEADRDSGLSNLEKAGLLALGALAVGAIMSNGQRVAATSGDRVIVEDNSGRFQVLKDDDALLRRPGSTVETRRFNDGSTTTTTTREDGSRVVTIRDASGRVLRRSVFDTSGRETLLIDDITTVEPVNVATLPPAPRMNFAATDRDALEAALREAERRDLGRTFSLRQVREIVEVRDLAPQISLEDVTFRSGSAAIEPSQAEQLREIGNLMRQMIRENPREVFLIEGYTDAVGGAASNLLLSDRRAESVALALTEYFDVPPENMVVQGFGERFLKIPTLEAERQNRRVAVRWITDLIAAR